MPSRQITLAEFNRSPLIAFYEITRVYDLACSDFESAQARPDPAELSAADGRRLVDQLADFPDPPTLVITGGDPLKRPDLFDLVAYASGRALDVDVTFAATSLVTTTALRRLRDSGMRRLAVSLDGADARTHDAQRGVAGSYERTRDIIATARGLQIPLQINTTLTPDNVEQIDELAEQLARLKPALWSVSFLVPAGRAGAGPRLTAEQYERAFSKLWRRSLCQSYPIKTTEAPHFRRFVLRQLLRGTFRDVVPLAKRQALLHRMTFGTNDGKGIMFVSHVGLIYPSRFLPILCGVFPLNSLVDTYQKSPVFCRLRDAEQLVGKCKVCEYRHLCGGCRARAYAVTGNLRAQEPDCQYIPSAMVSGSGRGTYARRPFAEMFSSSASPQPKETD